MAACERGGRQIEHSFGSGLGLQGLAGGSRGVWVRRGRGRSQRLLSHKAVLEGVRRKAGRQ